MVQQIMYPAMPNSPGTELSAAITAVVTTIPVLSVAALLAAPNLTTIGVDETSEVILYTGISGNTLTGCTRGFGGTTARSWATASKVARYFTAADHNAFKANIEDHETRLGRVDLTQVLGPGTSVITADQNGSELDMTVYGRTLVNILGSFGNFEIDSNSDGLADGWLAVNPYGAKSLETSSVKYGLKAQRITALAGDSSIDRGIRTNDTNLGSGKYYIILVDVVTDGTALALPRLYSSAVALLVSSTASAVNKTHILKYAPSIDIAARVYLYNQASLGSTGWVQFDGVDICEVDAALYARIGADITEVNIRDYLPHVDGKQHVQGVAITNQGRNLLPSIPETLHANAKMNGPYDMTLVATAGFPNSYIYAPALGSAQYTLSVADLFVTNQQFVIDCLDADGVKINTSFPMVSGKSYTFTTYVGTKQLRLIPTCSVAGTFNFKNWQLELGSTATPFTPAEPQSVILPVTIGEVGGIRDSVYSAGTEWMYVERVRKNVLLLGSKAWSIYANSTGYRVLSSAIATDGKSDIERVSKYDGTLLKHVYPVTTADQSFFNAAGNIYLTVSSIDSGWGDSYAPSAIEISAYFYGYRMNNGTFGTVYNGTGTKTWTTIGATSNTGSVTTVPTTQALITATWSPYTLDYALASPGTPLVIPSAEGIIALHPGGNQVNVETGVILREKANTQYDATFKMWRINNTTFTPTSILKMKTKTILAIYKGADIDSKWTIRTINVAYGNMEALIPEADYDPNATYYVTYIALDKYSLTSNAVETSATWRNGLGGVMSDVVQTVAELRQENDWQDFADDYIQGSSDNLRFDFTAHTVDNTKHVPHLGTTTNIGNAYSVSTTETISANQKFTVKFNVASSGAATLNISSIGSAKAIKKPGGLDAVLKIGVYTVFYDGTNFQLLGEGGEYGTAVASQVLAPNTIGTDAGIVTGTMVDNGAGGTVSPSTSTQTKAAGRYSTPITINPVTGTATAADVVAGKTFSSANGINLTGTGGAAKPYASGSGTASNQLVVAGLSFQPKAIIVRSSGYGPASVSNNTAVFSATAPQINWEQYGGYIQPAFTISANGFTLDTGGFGSCFWEAWG
ncbi:MAG: hypothetical protein K6T94_22445 [Paenibacillus sp.]|nr:hypothetical protein [Paenibacillus sp.]